MLGRGSEGEKQPADAGMSVPRALFAVALATLILARQARPRISQLQRRLSRCRRSVCAVRTWRAGDGARLRVPPRGCPSGAHCATGHSRVVAAELELTGWHIRKVGCRQADLKTALRRSTNREPASCPGTSGRLRCRRPRPNLDNRLVFRRARAPASSFDETARRCRARPTRGSSPLRSRAEHSGSRRGGVPHSCWARRLAGG